MSRYTITEIIEATGGRVLSKGQEYVTGISIDSRTIKEGELFIALKGQRFDGHQFLEEALQRGSGAVVSLPPLLPYQGRSIIYVDNTLKALQRIARYRRVKSEATVIGVTGTNGKTTTKEMIATVLSRRYRVLRSRGNLNNQIGLPLCLTDLTDEEFAVLEMGASRVGDIRELCEIALPQIGVITNIGPAHLEGFGSIEQVRKTKLEMLEFVDTLIINHDDPMLFPLTGESRAVRELITYGLSEGAMVRATEIHYNSTGINFTLRVNAKAIPVKLNLFGRFNVYNALAAASVCLLFGCLNEFKEAIAEFRGVPMRHEIRHLKGATVISDLYNANPASMEEAVKELVHLKRARAVAVLGDMLELGAYSEVAHRDLGRWLATLPVDLFIGVGPLMRYACEEFQRMDSTREVYSVDDPLQARQILLERVKEGDTVLVKGSRGMKLERLLEE